MHAALRVLGPHAGKVVTKFEGAGESKEELRLALEQCIKLVNLTIDEKKSVELKQRCQDILRRH